MTFYHLATVFPVVRRLRIPFTRDQAMLLMIALNELLLGLDTYLAHQVNGTITGYEWIPILFGSIAGVVLLIGGLIALRRRMVANLLGTFVFLSSILVGALGSYFHWTRTILPNAPVGEEIQIPLIVLAPPLLGPITFALVGILGLTAAWQEEIPDSGILVLPGRARLHMPYSKTRAYFFLVGIGALITTISSMIDHSYSRFENPFTWIPTTVGLFSTAVFIQLGFIQEPTREELTTYTAAVALLLITGLVGTWLHISQDLTSLGGIVGERFIRGAPVMAPMLFANMGVLALIVLLKPGD
jgi:hypothetical protein